MPAAGASQGYHPSAMSVIPLRSLAERERSTVPCLHGSLFVGDGIDDCLLGRLRTFAEHVPFVSKC